MSDLKARHNDLWCYHVKVKWRSTMPEIRHKCRAVVVPQIILLFIFITFTSRLITPQVYIDAWFTLMRGLCCCEKFLGKVHYCYLHSLRV